jgi:hypothetical protein
VVGSSGGGLTDAELRATPVPVVVQDGGNVITVDGTVNVGNLPTTAAPSAVSVRGVNTAGDAFEACGGGASAGLTDAERRATPVAVSGPLTDAELRTTPVPVSGTVATAGKDAGGTQRSIRTPAGVDIRDVYTEAMRRLDAILQGYATPPGGVDHMLQATVPGNIPLVVRGAALQTADLTQWQTSTGTMLLAVTAAGAPVLIALNGTKYRLEVTNDGALITTAL